MTDSAYVDKEEIHGYCTLQVELDDAGKPVDLICVQANEELAQIEGIPLEKLVGHRFSEVFPNGDSRWLEFCYEAAYKGKTLGADNISEASGMYMHAEATELVTVHVLFMILRKVSLPNLKKRKNLKPL